MQLQEQINDPTMSSPSFNCYYSDSITAMAAAKVSREFKQEHAAQFHELDYVDEENFEFSIKLSDENVSGKQIDLEEDRRCAFPNCDNELLTNNEAVEGIDDASSFRIQVQKLFVDGVDEEESSSSSSSSTEAYNLEEARPSGMFCMWRSKLPVDVKNSSSTGSGSRWWSIGNLLRRSNTEGKKVVAGKQKRTDHQVTGTGVTGKLKTTSFHEQFYVQKRAEQKGDKTKTFLPYRQDLLRLSVNVNRIGNKNKQAANYHFII